MAKVRGDVVRDARVNVRLDDTMVARCESFAADMGLNLGTFCAVAIGSYVRDLERVTNQAKLNAAAQYKATKEVFAASFSDPSFLAQCASISEGMASAEGVADLDQPRLKGV